MNEDFYIGYETAMPAKLRRPVRIAVAAIFVVLVSLAAVLWLGQKRFARSVFEFGEVREFAGTIEARPIPFLLVEKTDGGGEQDGLPRFERFPLVAEGKHGFKAEGFDGRRVKLRGTLVYRDGLRMIEVAGDSVAATSGNAAAGEEKTERLGAFTLRGEIVDSKCYLGVMNPGSSKPHRDCAAACIRGGVPALFIVRDERGATSELWLVSAGGESVNQAILDFVAEPVEIAGDVSRRGDQLFFAIDPARISRLP